MPRFLSAVTTLSSFFPTVLIHTWRTLLVFGAIQASRLASGESWGLTRSGLPNNTSRGINGGNSARTETKEAISSRQKETSQRMLGTTLQKRLMTETLPEDPESRDEILRVIQGADPTFRWAWWYRTSICGCLLV